MPKTETRAPSPTRLGVCLFLVALGLLSVMLVLMMDKRSHSSEEEKFWTTAVTQLHRTSIKAMEEPTLGQPPEGIGVEEYRFLWLRSFHPAIAVRIRKEDSGIMLRIVRLGGVRGPAAEAIEHQETFAVTSAQWDEFQKLTKSSSFWGLSTFEEYERGRDGATWVLEGSSGGRYHRVDRWSPLSDRTLRHLDGFVACCRYLLMLAKQPIAAGEDY